MVGEETLKNTWIIIKDSNALNIGGALAILIIGWLVSLLVKRTVLYTLKKYNFASKLSACLPEGAESRSAAVAKVIGGIVFWCLFLLTILACLSVLNLTEAATPIQEFLNSVWGYVPNIIAAAILIFISWILASIFKYLTLLLLAKVKLDEKIEANCDTKGQPCELSSTIGSIVSLLTYLFFLPAILSTLKIEGITAPLQELLAKILAYLPNLVAAAVIAAVGLFVAGLLRRLTQKVLDNAAVESFSEKIGLKASTGIKSIASLVSIVVYAIVALPVVAAALDALQISVLTNATGSLLTRLLDAAGNIFGAVLTVFAACLIAAFAAKLTKNLLSAAGFNKLFRILGLAKEDAAETDAPSALAGKIVQIAVIVFGITGALDLLGFSTLAELLRLFIPFAGNIILAAIVFGFGLYLANVAAKAAKSNGWESKLLICGIRIAILFFAGALALFCAGIAAPIIQTAFMLILGAVAVAAAIAFGIGGKDFAARKLSEWEKKDNK